MGRRSTKFYRKNEAEVMEALGLQPTVNSGAGWIEKEDGQNDYVLAQLKSTDAASISIKQKDIHVLEMHAYESGKIPVFVIQFLNDNSTFIMARPEDMEEVVEYINTGKKYEGTNIFEGYDDISVTPSKIIKGSEEARLAFRKREEEKWQKRNSKLK